ncbi:hypothetical protein QYF61_005915, partial [Mycteria americana]
MGRPGRLVISQFHKPTEAKTMCSPWWKQPSDGWKHILYPMPPPRTPSWALKSKSYGDMTPQKELTSPESVFALRDGTPVLRCGSSGEQGSAFGPQTRGFIPRCLGAGCSPPRMRFSVSGTSVPVDARVRDAEHHRKKNCTNISLGDRAEQNCLKAKRNAFTRSRTAVRSALPVAYRGVTYSASGIAPAY